MTATCTTPEANLPFPGTTRPLGAFKTWTLDLIARIGLPSRLSRLTERNLRDIGLCPGDIDWLRCQGSSQDAGTQLAIRAGMRAGNW
jgi:uncharacterized protein YjiS (DUF1127 family)